MHIPKISNNLYSQAFKGYQHEFNSVGAPVMRFNYVFDYDTKQAHVEIFKVKKNDNSYAGYDVITENPIARIKLEKNGTEVNLEEISSLEKDEPFAYRIVVEGEKPTADSGIKLNLGEYTLVSRAGTTPRVQGAGYLAFPDSQRVGVNYEGFASPNTGDIVINKNNQEELEKVVRNFSNKTGGNLAGLEYNLDYLASNGYKIQFANPIAGGDNKSSHHYWNKNNFQISDDMGNIENFNSYTRKLFQKGILYVYDGTFTSEGLEGIHFQYALRWANQNPQTYYWFKMQSMQNQALGLGVVPKNKENLRHRVINPPIIYDELTKKVQKNKEYNPNKETYFQVYDASQVTEEQLVKLDKPIESYEKIKSGNYLDINNHDDTLINYICEINPNEYEDRLNSFIKFNKNNPSPIVLNSPEGTIYIAQFSNFKFDKKTEGGFVAWDANTDMVKMNYKISGYDEKINLSNVDFSVRDSERDMRIRGAYEVQDMALQAGKYWTRNVKNAQTLYSAQVLKGIKTARGIESLITKGLLPKEALLNDVKVNNVLNGYYNLEPKGILDKDDVTIKALMDIPLDSLEFAENTVGVISTSYFSNRAINEETLGKTRFELMKNDNPHLVREYADTYLKMNSLISNEIKNFADDIIKKVDDLSSEKLIDVNGDYTEYGEYVIELMGSNITKYALLKSLVGDSLKTKVLSNGEITYDYKDIKERTSLKTLGINAFSPKDEAQKLVNLMERGLYNLTGSDVDYLASSISKRLEGTNLNSFRLAEAIVKEAGLGLAWRLDAGKDLVDQDAGRSGEVAFDENWQFLINYWKKFVDTVKQENPSSYIVAEITDVQDLMRDNLGEKADCYNNMPETGLKFKTVDDAMLKFFNETGITSEAGYSYFYSDLLNVFGPNFENGAIDRSEGRVKNFIHKISDLVNTRGIDYVRNLFTFVGNHDKPRIIHGLALDMGLFHANLDIFNKHGFINYELNRQNRVKSMIQLANADDFTTLPLEAKLNIDNPDYFRNVSTYAVAMSQLLRDSINDSLKVNNIASESDIKYLKLALVDLVNGTFLKEADNKIVRINIPELSSLNNALKSILGNTNISLTESEFNKIIEIANDRKNVEEFLVHGDFDWSGINEHIGKCNLDLLEKILRGAYEHEPSGEWDYMKYSLYTTAVVGLLRKAFMEVKGYDGNARYQFLEASKDFVKKYDRAMVEKNSKKVTSLDDSQLAMAKNGFGSKDIKTAIEMLVKQAEYKARLDGVLGDDEYFKNSDKIVLEIWKNSTEPAIQKSIMIMSFLSALVGIPTIFGGDELGLSGYDEKAKNIYLQCRNPLPWSGLEKGVFKEYRNNILKKMNDAMSIRSRDGVVALNRGTAYQLETSDSNIPAFMMQDGYGNMTISLFNANGIEPDSRVNYFEKLGINEHNKKNVISDNNIESINLNNPYVPIQTKYDINHIVLGTGLSLPIGLKFVNSDLRDKAVYVVKKIADKLCIVNANGGTICLNGVTAKNGTMVLKHVSKNAKRVVFKGSSQILNKQYQIVSDPYNKSVEVVTGKRLSIFSK